MKKIYYILIALLMTPILVDAEPSINTSFNNEECILTVSGEQTGHEATVSLFNEQNELIGFKTSEINNGNYLVDFVLTYDTNQTINITTSNELGTNEISKDNITILACEKTTNNTNNKNKTYIASDDKGNSITFKEEDGHTFSLSIFDFVGLTDEELSVLEIPKEMYQTVFEKIILATKNHGTLLSFYEIEVKDENNHNISDGPFNIKIKMTDDMKKYNTFKLIFVDTDDNFKTEEPIILTVNGEYLEGTINHLSTYALVGSQTSPSIQEEKNNPQTGDNITQYTLMLGLGIVGFIGTIFYVKKKMFK